MNINEQMWIKTTISSDFFRSIEERFALETNEQQTVNEKHVTLEAWETGIPARVATTNIIFPCKDVTLVFH